MRNLTIKSIFVLLLINLFYATVYIFSKYTSMQIPFTLKFALGILSVFFVLGLYAIMWQQVLKHIELSIAYMFKGSSLIFVCLFSSLLYNEAITLYNIIGACIIILGIISFSKS
jgi:drug/metabolite transporter (DMT)-like permease